MVNVVVINNTQNEVINLFKKRLPITTIISNESLLKDLNVDLLDLIDIILELEHKFLIEISDDDIYYFITVGDLINYIVKKLE